MTDLMKWVDVNDKAKELFDQKKYQEAVTLFEGLGPLPNELKINLAKCYYHNKQAPLALKTVIEVLDSQGATHELLIDCSLYFNAIGEFDRAAKILRSLKDQDDPKVKFNLGWHLVREGNFVEGFENLQYGVECRAWGMEYQLIEKGVLDESKRWNGIDRGCCLYILEGGLGDQLIFLRWARNLYLNHNMYVIVACDQSLLRLLVNAGYVCIPHSEISNCEYDFYIPAMSYPAMDKSIWKPGHPTDHVSFPYVDIDKEPFMRYQINKMKPNQSFSGLKIGFKWFGNPQFEHDQMRTLPKDELIEVLSKHGSLYSFQFEEDLPGIPNMKNVIRDWADTYNAVCAMDVIVTSCTSIAHLCGAMNKKCVVLTPLVSYFIWTSDQQWYNSVIAIRQTDYNDWAGAFEKLDDTLKRIREDRL